MKPFDTTFKSLAVSLCLCATFFGCGKSSNSGGGSVLPGGSGSNGGGTTAPVKTDVAFWLTQPDHTVWQSEYCTQFCHSF
jgi:hypothetical protein